MKTLWIARHAEAASHHGDSMRPLTLLGKQQASATGRKLRDLSPPELHVMCSSATRTVETLAQWIALSGWQGSTAYHADLYLANWRTLLEHICNTDESITHVCILAHNPGTSDLIHYLSRQHHALEPGEIAETTLTVKSWSEVSEGFGELVRIFKPES
jgi:phosphohistidine phosphatase SixA